MRLLLHLLIIVLLALQAWPVIVAQDVGLGGTDAERLIEEVADADRVTHGRVRRVRPRWVENEFGDRIIVTDVDLTIIEHIKGPKNTLVTLEVVGGTIDGLTMTSSLQDLVEQNDLVVAISQNGKVKPGGWLRRNADGSPVGYGPTIAQLRTAAQ